MKRKLVSTNIYFIFRARLARCLPRVKAPVLLLYLRTTQQLLPPLVRCSKSLLHCTIACRAAASPACRAAQNLDRGVPSHSGGWRPILQTPLLPFLIFINDIKYPFILDIIPTPPIARARPS